MLFNWEFLLLQPQLKAEIREGGKDEIVSNAELLCYAHFPPDGAISVSFSEFGWEVAWIPLEEVSGTNGRLRRLVYSGLGFCRSAVFAAAAAFILFVKLKAMLARTRRREKGDCGRTNAGSMARNSKAKGGGRRVGSLVGLGSCNKPFTMPASFALHLLFFSICLSFRSDIGGDRKG